VTKLNEARQALQESTLDAWLLYDFRHSNPLFWELLGHHLHSTRRVFLCIPRAGLPTLLVHHVDAGHFLSEDLTIIPYRDREELVRKLAAMLDGCKRVAMEYSPGGALPAVSWVDGGTLELVRSFGPDIESSAELAQTALCRLDDAQLASHRRAARALSEIVMDAFALVRTRLSAGIDERGVAQFIQGRFTEAGLWTDEGPVVAVNQHAGDPHYAPTLETSLPVREGDWLLIDLWAKEPQGIFGDITWVAYVGREPTDRQRAVFAAVIGARDAAVEFLAHSARAGSFPQGWEVDRVARDFIARTGYGDAFTHRLGHSLGSVVHGFGANLDGYETLDTRPLAPGLAFTIEPGIYLPDFGVRSEIDVYMTSQGPEITSAVQREIVLI